MPGKAGSNWMIASPAVTSASEVRLQARNVRSLAKVNRASGSVSVSPAEAAGLTELSSRLGSVPGSSPVPDLSPYMAGGGV